MGIIREKRRKIPAAAMGKFAGRDLRANPANNS
jgi:hypothetical protein